MATAVGSGGWRDVWRSGLFGRFVLLCIGVWLHAADSLVTATAVPAIVRDIGGVAYVGWTISLYQIGAIVAGAATALLCRRGVKRVLMAAALLYAAGCVVAALAPGMAAFLCARLVQGVGGGMLLSLSYVAIQQSFAEELWGRLFAVVAAIWSAGALLGPLIGGLFVHLDLWRGVFWCFALQAGILWLVAAARPMAHSPDRSAPAGLPVLRLLLLAAATLLIAQGGAAGRAVTAAAFSLAGLALLYLAARVDRRSPERLLPAQLLQSRHPMGAGLLAVFALSAATTGFWAYGPLLLQVMFDTAPLVSGFILACEALAWSAATMAVATAPLSAARSLIRIGMAGVALGAAGLAAAVPAGSFALIVACQLLQGLGFGLCWPAIVQRTVRCADAHERSLAAAAPGTVQRIGYAVGAAATGIAANLSGLGDGMSAVAARTAGFWVFAAFLPVIAVGLPAAWRFTSNGRGSP